MSENTAVKDELERIRRVSDTLCTGHAGLRDRYRLAALLLDVFILGSSCWLVALAFVSPDNALKLTPNGWNSQIWIGVISTATFFLAIVQLKTDWKGLADAHRRTFDIYAEIKRETGYLLSSGEIEEPDYKRILSKYDMASAVGVPISEREFLRQKQRHKAKVELSRHLDEYPFASLLLTRMRFWIRDNCRARL